jgi:hypothetical protein
LKPYAAPDAEHAHPAFALGAFNLQPATVLLQDVNLVAGRERADRPGIKERFRLDFGGFDRSPVLASLGCRHRNQHRGQQQVFTV